MSPRQSIPERWLILNGEPDSRDWAVLRKLPHGAGLLLLQSLDAPTLRRLRNLARLRGLTIVIEARTKAARVHDTRELQQALLRRTPLILLSPIHHTRSHPDWKPLGTMRGAALARLGGRRLVALGGMNDGRYVRVAPLGFIGWAGISAFRT